MASKQEQTGRVTRGELTVPELSRELAVSPSVVRRWLRLSTSGSATAVGANEDVVPAGELRAPRQRIKELERGLGKKAMEIEILQAVREEVKKAPASTPWRRTPRSAIDHPTSTGEPSSWESLSPSAKCLTKRAQSNFYRNTRT